MRKPKPSAGAAKPLPNSLAAIEHRLGAIDYRATTSLSSYANNPRRHPEKQLVKLSASIREFGFAAPVLVDEDGVIIAGEARILAAARRTHFSLFLMKVFETLHPGAPPLRRGWYLQAICHQLGEVRLSRTRRLVVTVPPRHLKSITVAVAYVAWLLGHDPNLKIMVASYSQDLARRHSNDTRTIMESAWYKADFPGTRISERGNRALELETTSGGVRKAVSVGGSITGFGADLIIVDDCMKSDEARSQTVRDELRNWFDNTLSTRRIVGIVARLSVGFLLDRYAGNIIGTSTMLLPVIGAAIVMTDPGPAASLVRGRRDIWRRHRR